MFSRWFNAAFVVFCLLSTTAVCLGGKKSEKKTMPSVPNQKIVFVHADNYFGIQSTRSIVETNQNVGIVSGSHVDAQFQTTAAANTASDRIAIMNPDGTGLNVLNLYGEDPAISPDGQKIAYISGRETLYWQIYVANIDGSSPIKITDFKNGDAGAPTWSHDGKKIAFYAFARINPHRDPAIWLIDPDGKNQKKIMESGIDPSWSPDDKQIAFASTRDGGIFQIYAMNADGSNVRRLTNHKGEDSNPAWAPDGAAIAYSSQASGDRRGLFLMSADGKEQHGVAHSKYQDFCFPAWSLDGKMIVFTALNRIGPQFIVTGEERSRCDMWNGEYQIFAMDNEGQTYQITDAKVMGMRASYGKAR